MNVWFTSDTHFWHKNILHLGEGRPFADINTHNEMLIYNWNSRVKPGDRVFHLGDVAMGPWPLGLNCVKRLNGYKILVPGNHDRISSVEKPSKRVKYLNDYEDAFQEIWGEVEPYRIGNVPVQLSHYPIQEVHYGSKPDRYMDMRPTEEGNKILVHGHTHTHEKVSRTANGTLQIHVGVDSWDYRPVSEEEIFQIISDEGLTAYRR